MIAGVLAVAFSWRAPFIVFAVPTLVFVVLLGAFAWSTVRRWRLLLVGAKEPRFSLDSIETLRKRINQTLVVALAQKKMPKNDRYRIAGVSHILIFVAFNVLAGGALRPVRVDLPGGRLYPVSESTRRVARGLRAHTTRCSAFSPRSRPMPPIRPLLI